MQNTAVKEPPVGRGSLITGTIIAAATLLGMLYLFELRYGITWPKIIWSLAFATLVFTTFYLEHRDKPAVRHIDRPGVFTLKTFIFVFVLIYLSSIPNSLDLIDTVTAEVWPLVLGAVLSWFVGSLYYLLLRSRP